MPDSDTQLALRRLASDDDTKIDIAEAALLLANRDQRCIILRLREEFWCDPP
mgnify:CR=1 FL=1